LGRTREHTNNRRIEVIFQIKNRFSGAVQFECELSAEFSGKSYSLQLGFAVKKAIKAGAYLADAYLEDAYLARADLAGADLAGADLAGAYLAGAYLERADLAGADLAGAYLAGADLAGAYLAGAYLEDAYLARANLAGAYLEDAYLARADLAGADLAGADLAGAYLAGARNVPDGTTATNPAEPYQRAITLEDRAARRATAAVRFRERNPDVPVIEQIDAKILAAITGGGELQMNSWHGESGACGTTHCRAGWAIHLAGDAGQSLEKKYGPERAGAMIYRAAVGYRPHFFASNEAAREDIRRCAAEQTQHGTAGRGA
jgi:hypothetical protein